MNRRGFFATLIAPLVAKYLPAFAPKPAVEEPWWSVLNVAVEQIFDEKIQITEIWQKEGETCWKKTVFQSDKPFQVLQEEIIHNPYPYVVARAKSSREKFRESCSKTSKYGGYLLIKADPNRLPA